MERTKAVVSVDPVFSHEQAGSAVSSLRNPKDDEPAKEALPYDFSRPDRIPKDQIRAIQFLHENFARGMASSLSAYLRAYVTVNLVSVEQLSFVEFSRTLPSPTVMISLGMKPYDGNAVLEMNPALVFPILETVLGGKGTAPPAREVTDIEQSILDGIFRIVLHDLRESWQAVTDLTFSIEGHETEPQLLQILAPNEAVVAVRLEARIGDHTGTINLGVPSILVKMLRQKFDHHWSPRKLESSGQEHVRVFNLIQAARLRLDCRLTGVTIRVEELLNLKVGDVLAFDYPVDRPVALEINGKRRFEGYVMDNGRKRVFMTDLLTMPDRGDGDSGQQPLPPPIAGEAEQDRAVSAPALPESA